MPDLAVASRDRLSPDLVWIVSGKDGSVVRTLRGKGEDDWFGGAIAGMGDLDADGTSDLAVMATRLRSETYSRVFSGKTGDMLLEINHCASVVGVKDVDRDGRPDLLYVALPTPSGGDSVPTLVLRFGQADKKSLVIEAGPEDRERGRGFGDSACWAGDINADGVPDIAVSIIRNTSLTGAGRVDRVFGIKVHSGSDGRQLWEYRDNEHGDADASILRLGSDVDGDGVGDLIAGLENRYVLTLSGRTGARLREMRAGRGVVYAFASSLDIVGDVDSDGVLDWAVGANEQFPGFECFDFGFAWVVSGKSGEHILDLEQSDDFGFDVSGVGDVDADKVPDIAELVERGRGRGSDPASMCAVNLRSGKDGHMIWQKTLPELRLASLSKPPR